MRAPEVSLGASTSASLTDDEDDTLCQKARPVSKGRTKTDTGRRKRNEKRRCTPQREGTRIAPARPGVGRALQG